MHRARSEPGSVIDKVYCSRTKLRFTNMDIARLTFWTNLFGWSAVTLTALGALAGSLAWYFTVQLGSAKDQEDKRYKTESSVKMSEAEARIAEAKEYAAKAELRAAEANQKAEAERLARVKIEERLAERKLTDVQLKVLASKLSVYRPQEFEITPYWDHRESKSLADRICEALRLAGWRYVRPENGAMLFSGVTGIQVYAHPDADETTKKAADLLVSSLLAEGLTAERKSHGPSPVTNKLSVNIGTKL